MNRKKIEAIGVIVSLFAIIVTLFAWLMPFNPVGTSPVMTILKPNDKVTKVTIDEPTLDVARTLVVNPNDQIATNESTLENNQDIIPCQILLYSESFDQDSENECIFSKIRGPALEAVVSA